MDGQEEKPPTMTNHWWNNVTVKVKKGELDITIKKAQTNAVVVQPPKPVAPPPDPWTSQEIVFVVGVPLVLIALGIVAVKRIRKSYRYSP